MSRCASCAATNPIAGEICAHHVSREPDWAVANRVFCDLLHRRIEPAPVRVEISLSYEDFELVASG